MINELATNLIDDYFDDEDKIVLALSWLVHLYNSCSCLSVGTKLNIVSMIKAFNFYLDKPFVISFSDDGKLEVK